MGLLLQIIGGLVLAVVVAYGLKAIFANVAENQKGKQVEPTAQGEPVKALPAPAKESGEDV